MAKLKLKLLFWAFQALHHASTWVGAQIMKESERVQLPSEARP